MSGLQGLREFRALGFGDEGFEGIRFRLYKFSGLKASRLGDLGT